MWANLLLSVINFKSIPAVKSIQFRVLNSFLLSLLANWRAFLKFQCTIHRLFNEWPVPLIRQLNTTTRMPVKIFFVMLIGDIIIPFALGIQCLHEKEKTAKYSGSCI